MPRWKELLKAQSEEFIEDSADANSKLNKARQDLETKWSSIGERELVMKRWYTGMLEAHRRKILEDSLKEVLALSAMYGFDERGTVDLVQELFQSPNILSKDSFKLPDAFDAAVNSEFDKDIDEVTETFRKITTLGNDRPTIRLTRKQSNKKVEYSKPEETIWWFATMKRLFTCVFFISLMTKTQEFNTKVVVNNLKEIVYKVLQFD